MSLLIDPWLLLKQAVLFAHVIAFAMTLSAVLREDLRWLLKRRIDIVRLHRTARTVTHGLVLLWATGLALWAFAAAASPVPWGLSPKLGAKLVVVTLLTLNGWALHAWVFSRLRAGGAAELLMRPVPLVLGAFSSASWLFAAFVGVARPMAGVLSFGGFMALYALSVSLALSLALAPKFWRRAHTVSQARTRGPLAPTGR